MSGVFLMPHRDGDMLANRLAAVANPTRIEILRMLSHNGSMPFSVLSKRLNTSNPSVVHHLSKLIDAGLIQKTIPNDLNSRTYRAYKITDAGKETLEQLQRFESRILA